MKKSLVAIVVAASAIAAHANQLAPKVLVQQGGTLVVSEVQGGKVVAKEVFDGVRIVRLPDGNCQIENHRYTPNPINPLDGKVAVTSSVIGYNCVLNQPPVAAMDAFK